MDAAANASTPLLPSPSLVPYARRDSVAIILICLVWTVLAIVIDPRGDFPLNDDWAYGLPVKALMERGEFRLTDWTVASLVSQEFWGALFCLPAGFSYTALRISTLVLGLVGLIGLYGLLRQLGQIPWSRFSGRRYFVPTRFTRI